MTDAPALIFDRAAVKRNRARAVNAPAGSDFLHQDVSERFLERRLDIARNFENAAIIGGRGLLNAKQMKCDTLIELDSAPGLLPSGGVMCDEEILPLKDSSFDAIFSFLNLHQLNDVPGALVQINRALKPDGLFMAVLFAGDTLANVREAVMAAEAEARGGISPRFSPFIDIRDGGGLLQRAGFALPVADREPFNVTYSAPQRLFEDLRHMGEANALAPRARHVMGKASAAALLGGAESLRDENGVIPVTFDLLFLTSWAPGPDQPRPLAPGSAKTRLAEVLGTSEGKLPV